MGPQIVERNCAQRCVFPDWTARICQHQKAPSAHRITQSQLSKPTVPRSKSAVRIAAECCPNVKHLRSKHMFQNIQMAKRHKWDIYQGPRAIVNIQRHSETLSSSSIFRVLINIPNQHRPPRPIGQGALESGEAQTATRNKLNGRSPGQRTGELSTSGLLLGARGAAH